MGQGLCFPRTAWEAGGRPFPPPAAPPVSTRGSHLAPHHLGSHSLGWGPGSSAVAHSTCTRAHQTTKALPCARPGLGRFLAPGLPTVLGRTWPSWPPFRREHPGLEGTHHRDQKPSAPEAWLPGWTEASAPLPPSLLRPGRVPGERVSEGSLRPAWDGGSKSQSSSFHAQEVTT